MTEPDPSPVPPGPPTPARAKTLATLLASKSNDAVREVAFGLGMSAAWTSRGLGLVSDLFRRSKPAAPEPEPPAAPSRDLRPDLRPFEERLRDLLLEERERRTGSPSPDDLGRLASRLSDLLGRILVGEARPDDLALVQTVQSMMGRSRTFADLVVSQVEAAPPSPQKSSILKRIMEENLRLKQLQAESRAAAANEGN
jgi:hypothetical protein